MAAGDKLSATPSRALVHPLWLGSLAVLVINDHVLKGLGLIPTALTGKTSDFAGLVVAPLVLAVVLGLRSEASWRLAHVAVGAVFAAIQLSPAFADMWSAVMGTVGFPWAITCDATDLIALPMLAVSWSVLGRAMQRPTRRNVKGSVRFAAAGAGLMACVATSYESEPEPVQPEPFPEDESESGWDGEEQEEFLPDLVVEAYINNATASDVIVRLRALRADVDVDCDVIAEEPGRLITSPLLGDTETWTLPAGTNQDVRPNLHGACRVVLVEVDGLPPRLLFWMSDELPPHTVRGAGGNPGDPSELAIAPADNDGNRRWNGASSISHDLTFAEPECAPQTDGARLAVSEPIPYGIRDVAMVTPGHDGCFEVLLVDDGGNESWFVCIPEATMVLQAGDQIDVSGALSDGLAIEVLGQDRWITLGTYAYEPVLADLTTAFVPDFDCEAEVQPECGTVASPLHVAVSSPVFGSAQLRPGAETTTLSADGHELSMAAVHAQQRHAVEPVCSLGPDFIGPDVELVVAHRPVTE